MVSVLVVNVLVADDGLQVLLEGADRLRIADSPSQTVLPPLGPVTNC